MGGTGPFAAEVLRALGDRWLAASLGVCGYGVCREADPQR